LPFTDRIRYHVLPATGLPAHVVRHEPPVTLAFATTFVPVELTFLARADVDALVRRFALHFATLVEFAPRASPGTDTAAMANTRIADRNEVAIRAMRRA
jgi:hypothetical protein